MVEVLPLASHRLMRLGQQGHRLPSAMAPALPTRYATLRGFECALGLAIPARMEDAGPVRQRGECLNAKVYPGLVSC
jgi:hypothetical protein